MISVLLTFAIALPAIYILEGGRKPTFKNKKNEVSENFDKDFALKIRQQIDNEIKEANMKVFGYTEYKKEI